MEKHYNVDQEAMQFSDSEEQKPNVNAFPYNNGIAIATGAPLMMQAPQSLAASGKMNHEWHTDSSGSEHVLSPEFKEVQSEAKWSEAERGLDFQLNYMDGFQDDPFASQTHYNDPMSLLQDMFGYVQKPF